MSLSTEAIAALLDSGERAVAGEALDAALIELHGTGEVRALCDLHRLAARFWDADAAQQAFHLTHAWVYALEGGLEAEERVLSARLREAGRL